MFILESVPLSGYETATTNTRSTPPNKTLLNRQTCWLSLCPADSDSDAQRHGCTTPTMAGTTGVGGCIIIISMSTLLLLLLLLLMCNL